MSTTNWVIAIIVVAILGVGAYFYFDNDSKSDAMMEDHGAGQLKTNPDAMGSSTDAMHDNGDMMSASGTVKVNTY